MAGEKVNTELDEKAFAIFKETVAKSSNNRGGEQQARAAYMKAEAFLAVRESIRSGDLKPSKPTGPALADCCAPNLHRMHPHNLVSKRFGDLSKVRRVHEWLNKNPTPDDPSLLVERMKNEFPELQWESPAINIARAIFPAYVTN